MTQLFEAVGAMILVVAFGYALVLVVAGTMWLARRWGGRP